MSVLDAIGNTSLVRLRRGVPPDCAAIYVKLEWENPTGSLEDRMAHAVIERAEQDGRLAASGTVVEYTGGGTGTSLALVCAAKGYRIHIVVGRTAGAARSCSLRSRIQLLRRSESVGKNVAPVADSPCASSERSLGRAGMGATPA